MKIRIMGSYCIGIICVCVILVLLGLAVSRAAVPGPTSGTLTPTFRTKAEALKEARDDLGLEQFETAPSTYFYNCDCDRVSCTNRPVDCGGDPYCCPPGSATIKPVGVVYGWGQWWMHYTGVVAGCDVKLKIDSYWDPNSQTMSDAHSTCRWSSLFYQEPGNWDLEDRYGLSLKVVPAGGGSISFDPPGGSYEYGTTVRLTAVPASGYHFDHWERNLTGTTNPGNLVINGNRKVTAVFSQEYVLTVNASPSTGGTVSGAGTYTAGTVATITAVPAGGYRFDHWEGDASGTVNPLSVSMNGNKTVTAVFVPSQFTLTMLSNPSGHTARLSGGGTYEPGATATISAWSGNGFRFTSWSGDVAGSTNPTTLAMTSNKTVTGNFERYQYYLSVHPDIQGIGNYVYNQAVGWTEWYACAWIDMGTSVQIAAAPGAGYRFDHWLDTQNGATYSENPRSVTMNADRYFEAVFKTQYTLTVNANPVAGGSVSGGGTYDAGAVATITATPAPGYQFCHWIHPNGTTSTNNPRNVTMSGDKTFTAVFAGPVTLTVNASPAAGGSVSGGGTYNVFCGGSSSPVQVTATPAAGYRFDHWTGDASGSVNPTYVSMDGDKTVTAVFVKQYTLTVNASPSSGGTVAGAGTYDEGAAATITATPAAGYQFCHWVNQYGTTFTDNPRNVTMNSDKTFTAVFIRLTCTLTVNASPSGGGSVSGGGTYNVFCGGSSSPVQVTATPAAGYRFDRWTGDASGSVNPTYVSMDGDKTVTAVFVKQYTLTVNASPAAAGSVSGGGTYDDGATATITATPGVGYKFDHWVNNNNGYTFTANPRSITMSGDKSFTAVFKKM